MAAVSAATPRAGKVPDTVPIDVVTGHISADSNCDSAPMRQPGDGSTERDADQHDCGGRQYDTDSHFQFYCQRHGQRRHHLQWQRGRCGLRSTITRCALLGACLMWLLALCLFAACAKWRTLAVASALLLLLLLLLFLPLHQPP